MWCWIDLKSGVSLQRLIQWRDLKEVFAIGVEYNLEMGCEEEVKYMDKENIIKRKWRHINMMPVKPYVLTPDNILM